MSEISDKMNEKGSLDLLMQIIPSPGDKDEAPDRNFCEASINVCEMGSL